MADFSFITNYLLKMVGSAFFWVALIFVGMIIFIFAIKIKRKRRLKITVIEIVDIGNDKLGFTQTKAGWFKKDSIFFGLIERGRDEEFITKEGKMIYGSRPEDYMEFNGKRTLFVTPALDDPMIVFPVNKMGLTEKTRELLAELAPIEVREAAVEAYRKTVREMKNLTDQIVQWILIGLFFIVAFLVVLFITQYGKHMVDKATEINAATVGANTEIANKYTEAVATLKGLPVGNQIVSPVPVAPTPPA